jgi:F-type H+-transporting ATPase subunit delta
MKISKTAAVSARRLFGLCQTSGRLDDAKLRMVVTRLIESQPRDYRAVLAALQRLTRLELERRKVTVESAVELDGPTRQRVMGSLAKSYGSDLVAHYQINPALLGGLRIRVGNDVLDGSVQGRLDRLANAF